MAGFKLTVGNVEVAALLDTHMEFPFDVFFPRNSPQDWEPDRETYPEAFGGDGRFRTCAQCYVLRSQGRTVLADTGLGAGPIAFLGGIRGRLLEDMSDKGVRPEEIDTVVFTHLHGDHVGWNMTAEGKPTFAGARYLVPQADWDHFTSPQMIDQSGVKQTVIPLKDLGAMELFSGETALTEEITTLPTPGHTPGHTSILISSAGERAVLTGDLAHHPAQVERTEWCSAFDGDPQQAIDSRRKVFDRLEAEGLVAAVCHFPVPGFGKLVRVQGKRMWQAL